LPLINRLVELLREVLSINYPGLQIQSHVHEMFEPGGKFSFDTRRQTLHDVYYKVFS